jgi:DNA-directed RNA polymerase specialized sigma subunit
LRTDLDVDQIRSRYAGGESQQAIADDIGISQGLVSQIVRYVGRFATL